ncbi:Variant-specific surface protein, partial [Giardia duodenalis]
VLLAIYLGVGALAAACNGGTATANCDGDNCEMVGTTQICTQCKQNFVPVNGQCAAKEGAKTKCADATGATATDQTCKKCLSTTFMYKGGCYEATATPGKTMCKTAEGGKCTAAVETKEYFVPPEATNAKDSVVWCGDATGVTLENGKKYTGVDGCTRCDGSALTNQNNGAAVCETCQEGYYGANTPLTCTACQDDNCATCQDGTNTKKCSKCKATGTLTYLRKEDSSETGTCVDAATCTNTNTYYTDDTEPKMCKKCSESLTNCEQCTSPSSLGSSPACTKCATPNYLKTVDGTTTCVAKDACKDGFFPVDDSSKGNKCLSCGDAANGVPNCAKCTLPSGAAKPTCSECNSGYKLEGEACVPASTNLSTGAIAGISVATVVVVEELVDFLCR